MKELIIVRHAKSSWSNPSLEDHDRPLNSRGKRDAPFMARVLYEKGYRPEYAYISTSRRTRDTAKHFIKEFELLPDHVFYEESLYHGYTEDYESIIYGIPEDQNHILFFGHNPGITFLANSCIGMPIHNVPTTGIIVLHSGADTWAEFQFSKAEMKDFMFPKQYV